MMILGHFRQISFISRRLETKENYMPAVLYHLNMD